MTLDNDIIKYVGMAATIATVVGLMSKVKGDWNEEVVPTQHLSEYYSYVQQMPDDELRQFCTELTGRDAPACAYVNGNTCYKFIPIITNLNEDLKFQHIGHEDLHCIKGAYHK